MGESAMRLGGIRRNNVAEITIRLTQQGMVISDTAGNGNFASLIPIPYCANHNLPSPTDTHLQFTALPRRTTALITIRHLRRRCLTR